MQKKVGKIYNQAKLKLKWETFLNPLESMDVVSPFHTKKNIQLVLL